MSISDKMLKILWAQSGGLCAFPGCNEELIVKDKNQILGHMCHIVAKSPNGPRGSADIMPQEADNAY
ncbi:MAG: hypothetical protein LBT88_08220, partial [Oscillospiraceae bacterium]|nr:hypothetical protein [Oscillospiraceae bacterium]